MSKEGSTCFQWTWHHSSLWADLLHNLIAVQWWKWLQWGSESMSLLLLLMSIPATNLNSTPPTPYHSLKAATQGLFQLTMFQMITIVIFLSFQIIVWNCFCLWPSSVHGCSYHWGHWGYVRSKTTFLFSFILSRSMKMLFYVVDLMPDEHPIIDSVPQHS